MSTTLNLVDHLLSRGRHLQEIGREQDTLHVLERLACFRQLPAKVAEETRVLLAELLLERAKERRCITIRRAWRQWRPVWKPLRIEDSVCIEST